jgi:hypothetical protein
MDLQQHRSQIANARFPSLPGSTWQSRNRYREVPRPSRGMTAGG